MLAPEGRHATPFACTLAITRHRPAEIVRAGFFAQDRAMVTVKHLRIAGRVQGVGFRNYMEYKARQLGVTGWVRNRRDGTVEAMVRGAPEAVAAMVAAAHRGPRSAYVTDVKVAEGSGEFTDFAMRPTE